MRFSTISAIALPILSSFALADDTVTVSDLTVRNINSTIYSVSFSVANTTCSASQPTAVVVCGDSPYRFYIEENSLDSYNLTIYEQTGVAVGLYKEQEVSTICRAGPTGATDYVCQSFSNSTFTLTFDGQ
ncbi:uncharacterized protein LY89DRAFT_783583 [Mollisia scopiformis]|uniref:AA1-like domain-containing protein n=1 Tax=Mollisia scopiformis TaxID=149040 RepID=A0A194X6L0_MOLSC|nr:uncharacterized protein LY89DRAFT_783583 [Mollisia scopiformis]KUJ15437.1 hypothetical protein LY89DRAFT_783583 [Mollisia scopiformis]